MGTDALGRDLFTRVLYGGRISLFGGLIVVGISISIGAQVGEEGKLFGSVTSIDIARKLKEPL